MIQHTVFQGLPTMFMLQAVTMLVVIVAMAVDLIFGWHKAKARGEAHSSYAFSRTFTKFLLYEGVLVMSGCIDVLVHFVAHEYTHYIYIVPLVTLVLGIVLCLTELWSMREKADEKQRNRIDEAARMLLRQIEKRAISD